MQISKKTLTRWDSLRDKGDNQKLAKILDMDVASVSRILSGKQETTSDLLLKIKDFFKEKKKLKKLIEAA